MTANNDCSFKFVPRLATADAWANREFGDYTTIRSLFRAMVDKEKSYGGYIYFKDGCESLHDYDNTVKIYNNPHWWELGASSCVSGCCKVPLEADYIIGTVIHKEVRQPHIRRMQEFFSVAELAQQFGCIQKKESIERIWLRDCGWFYVNPYVAKPQLV